MSIKATYNINVTSAIIENRALPNDTTNKLYNLNGKLFFGDESLVKQLLEKGANVKTENSKGETALDIVSKDWDSRLESTYQNVGRSLNRKFDLRRLQKVRPQIASFLEKNASSATDDSEASR